MGSLVEKWNKLSRTQMMIISGIAAVLIIGIVLLCVFLNSGYFAKTMRLLRIEGYVSLIDEAGTETAIFDNMRFASGQTLSTGVDSLASIGFDDNKIVTLQESSRATFVKSGKMMELVLDAGGVFFEVNKPLEDDESFDIRTSTMICGIRGTSGYVYVDENGNSVLVLTSGHTHVTGVNPVTGLTKETDVNPGQRITVYVVEDTVEFFLEDVGPEDLVFDHLKHITDSADLLDAVCTATGWDANVLRSLCGGVEVIETTETISETSAETTAATTASTEETEAEATPTPTNTPTPTPNATQTTATTTATVANTATPTPRATATPTPRATATPTPRATATPTPAGSGSGASATATPTPRPTNTPTPTPRPTNTPAPTNTPTPTPRPTNTPTPTDEPTPTPTEAHRHEFSNPDCENPGRCSCGETDGEPLGHNYGADHTCTRCGAVDPDYDPEPTPVEETTPGTAG